MTEAAKARVPAIGRWAGTAGGGAIAIVALCLLVLLLLPGPAAARSLKEIDGPANYPPPGFKGRQFIDNRGCVFVRAGFGNRVVWVPRVTRGGRLLCGYKPTFAPGKSPLVRKTPQKPRPSTQKARPADQPPAASRQPPRTPRKAPVAPRKAAGTRPAAALSAPAGKRIRLVCPPGWELRADRKCHRLPQTATRKTAAKAAPAVPPETATAPKTPPALSAPAGKRIRLVCPPGWELRADRKCHRLPQTATGKAPPGGTQVGPSTGPAPRKAVAAAPRRAPAGRTTQRMMRQRTRPGGRIRLICQGGWELRSDGKCHYLPIGTLPETPSGSAESSALSTPRSMRAAAAVPSGSGSFARLLAKTPPRRSLREPNGAYAVTLPEGYRPEVPLERFNPWRAVGTDAGDAAMAQIWTDDLPRRLRPEIRHRPVATLSSRSAPTAPVKRRKGGLRLATTGPKTGAVSAAALTRDPLPPYATPRPPSHAARLVLAMVLDGPAVHSDADPAITLPAPAPVRIQLATFAAPGRAESARARFAALGFPARIHRFSRGGRRFATVILGPFASGEEAAPALARARRECFTDALLLR